MKNATPILCAAFILCTSLSPVAYGANLASIPNSVMSPVQKLYISIESGDIQGVADYMNYERSRMGVLSDAKIDLEFRDPQGNTPLIKAAQQKNVDIVRYLVQRGADINAYNSKFETPLITAYNNGNLNNAQFLLSQGAIDNYDVAGRISTLQASAAQTATGSIVSSNAAWAVSAAAVAGGGIALAAGGGGGSDSGGGGSTGAPSNSCGGGTSLHPTTCDPATFNTTEAQQQEGVLAMKANYAIAHGYDGRIYNRVTVTGAGATRGDLLDDTSDGHVLIAEIDSGVDVTHPDLDGNILTSLARTCTYTNGCVAGATDQDGHGTKVAGIMVAERNGVGMHGVAPEARLIPIAAAGIADGSIVGAFEYANVQNAQVINNSYGLTYGSPPDDASIPIVDATGPAIPTYHPGGVYSAPTASQMRTVITDADSGTTFGDEIQTAVAAHRIMVFAAGNDAISESAIYAGLPVYFQGATAPAFISQSDYNTVNPTHLDWSNNWVSVVSVNSSNVLSSFSNHCGVSKNWCLAAPGEISDSTENGGGYTGYVGGTSFAAPNVTGAIAVMLGAFPQLAPETALEVLFDTATDLGAAGVDDVFGHGLVNLQKATEPSLGGWTISTLSVRSFAFANSGFSLSAPFGNAVTLGNSQLMFLDSYGKDYTVPLTMLGTGLSQRKTSYDRFAAFNAPNFDNEVALSDHSKASFTNAPQQAMYDPTSSSKPFSKFSYQTAMESGVAKDKMLLGFNYKTNLANSVLNADNENLSVTDALKNPYLNLVESATSSKVGYQSGHMKVAVTSYSGKFEDEYRYRFNNSKGVTGVFSEASYSTKRNTLSLVDGVIVESNSLLGSETSGAFAINDSTTLWIHT